MQASGAVALAFRVIASLIILASALFFYLRCARWRKSKKNQINIAFFHPYCCSGGGGERVLWCAVQQLQKYKNVHLHVYTGDVDHSPDEIVSKVKEQFGISLSKSSLSFVYLKWRFLLNPNLYARLTLICQSVAGMLVGLEALLRFQPDVFVESTGFFLAVNLFRLLGSCKTACYVHYPTISTDMLQLVDEQRVAYNNDGRIASSTVLKRAKLLYYRFLANVYKWFGHYGAQVIMVNSSWTKDHIIQLWNCPERTRLVYPPCDVTQLSDLPLDDRMTKGDTVDVVVVGQFRPEKNYPLAMRSFKRLRDKLSAQPELQRRLRLVLIGGARDQTLLDQLKQTADRLAISDATKWHVNIPYTELVACLSKAVVGMHTMWNEHFGIGVVEIMAAGAVLVAHNSGGPKVDIVKPDGEVGFLASTEEEYADAVQTVLRMNLAQRQKIQLAARQWAQTFSVERFQRAFFDALEPLLVDQPLQHD